MASGKKKAKRGTAGMYSWLLDTPANLEIFKEMITEKWFQGREPGAEKTQLYFQCLNF